jgi:hypothetical protein
MNKFLLKALVLTSVNVAVFANAQFSEPETEWISWKISTNRNSVGVFI